MGGTPTSSSSGHIRSIPTTSLDEPSLAGSPLWCRRFIGRARELDVLHDVRLALARGRGSLTLIAGEAGIGKSRLTAEALREVRGGRASRIITVDCVQEAHGELWPFRSALGGIWPAITPDAPALVLRTIAQLVPDEAARDIVQRYAGATLGKAELFAGLRSALGIASAKRGTILVLEDIHWADRTTLEFLAFVAPALDAMRLMIVATYRNEEFEASATLADVLSRLLRARSVRHLPLEPFAASELAAMIDGALDGRRTLPLRTRSTIIERCEGNPFFAEELLKSALERRSSERIGLPISIRASIRHRLANLDADDRTMLDAAALLGVRFEPAYLPELTGRTSADVFALLRRARAANLVDEIDASMCRFHHALIRQTIYEALPAGKRIDVHRRILAMLERAPASERTIEALAYHAWEAQDTAAAQRYSERAGDHAMTLGMYADARSSYERMLPLLADTGDRARLFERLGEIAKAQADFPAAITANGTALALRLQRDELDDAARIATAIAVDRSNSGLEATAELERFLAAYGSRLGARARDGATTFLARYWTALDHFDRAAALLRDVSPPADLEPNVRANYLTCRLNLSERDRDLAVWRDAAREMLVLAPALPPLMRCIALTSVAQTGAWFGERAVVQEALRDARVIAQHWGLEGIATFGAAVTTQLALLDGDLAEARRALDAVARRPDVTPAQILAARFGPFVAAELGDPTLAARCFESDAVRAAMEEPDPSDGLYLDAALLLEERGVRADARSARLGERIRAFPPGSFLPTTIATLAAQRLDHATIDDLIAVTAAAAAQHGDAAAMATHELVQAIVAQRRRAPEPQLAQAAADRFAALGWPLFTARALEYAGRTADARTLYESCGAAAAVQRLGIPESRGDAPSLLTAREREIALLVARGAKNAQMASELHVGVKTIEKHVSRLLAKLGARSRAQIAAYIASEAGANAMDRVSPHRTPSSDRRSS